jgi:hypothetical protein
MTYLNCSIPLNISGILGMGNGRLARHLLSILKSVIRRTLPFFFGMMKVGAAHSADCTCDNSPILSNLSISPFVTSKYAFGMEYALLKNGFDPDSSSKWIGSPLYFPGVP